MMNKVVLLIICCLLIPFRLSAQYYLELKKRTKRIEVYQAGDYIHFKLKGDDFYSNQMILGFSDQKIKFRFAEVDISEIEVVKLGQRSNYGLDLISSATITAGVFFMIIDQANQLFVQDEGLGPSSETLIISGSLIGVGLLMKSLKKKKFRMKGRYRLATTNYNSQSN